jgi:hypothetical protein
MDNYRMKSIKYRSINLLGILLLIGILTGKIVIAHLKETMDYYERIEVAEIEGDLLKAVLSKNLKKIESKYKLLIEAQKLLNQSVAAQLKK